MILVIKFGTNGSTAAHRLCSTKIVNLCPQHYLQLHVTMQTRLYHQPSHYELGCSPLPLT